METQGGGDRGPLDCPLYLSMQKLSVASKVTRSSCNLGLGQSQEAREAASLRQDFTSARAGD